MPLEHITTITADGVQLPIYDLRQPRFTALLASYLDEIQQLEDALWSVYLSSSVAYATGDALDMLGALVGQPRAGRSDADYRLWITARIRLNHSSGRPRDIYGILRAIFPATVTIELTEYPPAAFTIALANVGTLATSQQLGELMHEAKAAGVNVDGTLSPVDPALAFTLGDAAAAPQIDANRGLADETQTTGGQLVGAF